MLLGTPCHGRVSHTRHWDFHLITQVSRSSTIDLCSLCSPGLCDSAHLSHCCCSGFSAGCFSFPGLQWTLRTVLGLLSFALRFLHRQWLYSCFGPHSCSDGTKVLALLTSLSVSSRTFMNLLLCSVSDGAAALSSGLSNPNEDWALASNIQIFEGCDHSGEGQARLSFIQSLYLSLDFSYI